MANKVISQEDANLKLLRSLPSAWNNIALIMRNKSDLDTLSMDDLYNNLKVYESDIKSQSSLSSNSQNVAFVSLNNSGNSNETVNTAYSVSAASSKEQASTASYADDVMLSFFFNQSNAPQLDNEDLEHIDTNDLEEMDFKWQVAMLTMRVKRECMTPRNQWNRNRDAPTRNTPVDTSTTNTLVVQDRIGGDDWSFQAEEELINFALMAYTSQDKTSLGYDSQMNESDLNDIHVNKSEVLNNVVDNCEIDEDDNQVNDRFKKGEGYHAVPPPYTRNYMPPRADLSLTGLDNFFFKSKEDANLKLLRSLPSAWNNIALIMRNKSDLDTLSMDDLYNNLKVYESDIKSQSSLSSNSQNVAFVSSNNSSNSNETVNTAYSVSASSSKEQASTASYADDVMLSFFFNQSNAPQLDNKDLEHIDTNDLEEMDFKWQVAMLTMRVKRNRDAPTRNTPVDTSTTNALVVQDRIGGDDWSIQAEEELTNFALMAYTSQDKTGLGYYSQMNESDLNDIHVNESEVLNNVVNNCEIDEDDNQVNDRFKRGEGYHAVSPPYTRNYMPQRADLSFTRLDNFVFKSKVSETINSVSKIETNASKTSKNSLEKPKTIRSSTPIIKD
uniref:Uncharacterized protein n=1 Tax=Tanacetum cinerariifolium TaxID=118510 RepID=A0A699IMV9_TANCI|nr:hypothetical protein [Tanacetum cinerariifolium]